MRAPMFHAVCLVAVLSAASVAGAMHRCKLLASRLAEACPVLERTGESGAGEPGAAAGAGAAAFGPECCQALARFNDARCLCNDGVLESMWNDFDMRRFAPALAAAASAAPEGCGLSVYAAYDGENCRPIGDGLLDAPVLHNVVHMPTRRLQAKGGCKKGDRIFQVLEGFEQAFGKLLDTVSAQEKISKLLDGDGPITMFTPISTDIIIEADIDGNPIVEDAETTLRRHILLGKYPTKKLKAGQKLTTESGETLDITEESGDLLVNGVAIVQKDIKACNGWIHVVNKPLPPLTSGQKKVAEEEKAPAQANASPENVATPAKRPPTRNPVPSPSTTASKAEGESSADPCKCSEDGIIAGQNTKRPGCAQHLLAAENSLLFCYVQDPQSCAATGSFDLAESGGFEGVSWRNCTPEEAANLPSVGALISDGVPAFQPAWVALFNHGELLNLLLGDGPFTVLVPSETALEAAAISDEEPELQAIARHHVIADRVSTEALLAMSGTGRATIATLDGVPLEISVDGDGSILIGDDVHIKLSDVIGANGVVHLVDKVVEEQQEKKGTPSPSEPQPTPLPQAAISPPAPASTPPPALAKPALPKPTLPKPALLPPAAPTALGGAAPSNSTLPLTPGSPLGTSAAVADELGLARPVGAGGLVKSRKAGNPCDCSKDGISGKVNTRRPGCKRHIKGERLFCYVQDPDNCPFGAASEEFPGSKVVVCADPCACSKTGRSGTVDTGLKGCDKHVEGQPDLCYVEKPAECAEGFKSERYPGSRWRYCPEEASKKPKPKPQNRDPCECSQDGKSGNVYTGQKGCGRYGPLGLGTICWVVEPTQCIVGIGSLRFPGAASRPC